MKTLSVTLPLRIVSVANEREHHMKKAARAKAQRRDAWLGLLATGNKLRALKKRVAAGEHLVVTLTRVGVRELDTDNLANGFKAVRDGVADALGIDDGDARITWCYAPQEKSNGYRARVELALGGA